MDESSAQVIVLAAGRGSRLDGLAGTRCKALLDLGARPLLQRAIDFAATLGASEVIVVGGYRIEQVRAFIAGLRAPRIRLVENPRYGAGNLLSLQAALPLVCGSFYLTNVDHVFSAAAARRVLSGIGEDITAFCEFTRTLAADEMKVVLDAQGCVRDIAKTLVDFDGGYIGLTHVPQRRLADYRAAADRTHERADDAAVAEQVLQTLAGAGSRVRAASLDGIAWCEIDTPHDYRRAQAMLAHGRLE